MLTVLVVERRSSRCKRAEYTTNGRRLLRRVLDRAGIVRRDALGRVVDIHALRHTAATGMARRGVPLVVAQRVLGHASPEMTAKVYTHLGLEDLRGAVEGVNPTHQRLREAAT